MADRSDLLTVDEVAAMLHCSRRSVERMLTSGRLPRVKHMKFTFVPRVAVERYYDQLIMEAEARGSTLRTAASVVR